MRLSAGNFDTINGPLGITATDDGPPVTFYTRDPHGNILNSHDTTGTRNYVTEYNSSVQALYNPSGSPVGSYTYAPYGQTHANTETGTTQAGNNPFRYISGYQDGTAGAYDGHYKLGARYYDTHAHFTQPDPANPGTGDYKYTNGDPMNQGDPSGDSFLDFVTEGDFVKGVKAFGDASTVLSIGVIGYEAHAGDTKGAFAGTVGLLAGIGIGALCAPAAVTGVGAIACAGASTLVGTATTAITSKAIK